MIVLKPKCAHRFPIQQIMAVHCNGDLVPPAYRFCAPSVHPHPISSLDLLRPAASLGERYMSQVWPLALFHISRRLFVSRALHCIHSVESTPALQSLPAADCMVPAADCMVPAARSTSTTQRASATSFRLASATRRAPCVNRCPWACML